MEQLASLEDENKSGVTTILLLKDYASFLRLKTRWLDLRAKIKLIGRMKCYCKDITLIKAPP